MSPRILLVEDEKGLATSLTDLLEVEGFAVTAAPSLRIARDVLKRQEVTLVLLDLTLPDGSGLELLDEIGALPQGPVVVVLTADSSLTTTVESIRRGAYDYLPKPFELESLLNRVKNALNHQGALAAATLNQRLRCLEAQARPQIPLPSSAMRSLHERLNKVAQRDSLPILVRGETGAGKEHICRLVHELSPRSAEPFVALNCATLERNLLQSELFGHERGAFTGANEKRRGLFELASRGTLLLDEVAEMPLDVQASFLRVLETGRFRRLGGSVELTTAARIVAATNMDIEALVKDGRFRQDLLYRLNAFELLVPPLRQRGEDCRALAEHFCSRIATTEHIAAYLTEDAFAALAHYDWPGNVRELKNVVERTVVIRGAGAITAQDLDLGSHRSGAHRSGAHRAHAVLGESDDEKPFQTLAELESEHIRDALTRCQGNRTQAARLLGVARSTLLRKLEPKS